MATIGDGLKDVFLAGVGAMAITGEKAKGLVDTLIEKGAITVDQGRDINSELKRKAGETMEGVRFDALEARMSVMTPAEREAFAAKAAEIAARPSAQAAAEAVVESVEDVAAAPEAAEEAPAAAGADEGSAADDKAE